jgi:hypothetical protein
MTSTTTVDCIGKNTSVNNGTYPTRKPQKKCRESNNEKQEPQTRIWGGTVTTWARMLWKKPWHSWENHSSVKEDNVKRRRDNDYLWYVDGQGTLKMGQMWENRDNRERWRSRIVLRLKPSNTLPCGCITTWPSGFELFSHHNKLEQSIWSVLVTQK